MTHSRVSIRSRYQKADAKEVMWTSSGTEETLSQCAVASGSTEKTATGVSTIPGAPVYE
jgi:hypothetical protein